MTKEKMEMIEQEYWKEFCLKFPGIAGGSLLAKLWLILWKHRNDDLVHIIWTNGFYHGWNQGIECIKQPLGSAPPEPISGQPGSP